ncbi:MAG TPA: PadR family transcriptional regulator [Mycobacteriales bacterium]|nr:PadR family transcriptional regulator [Mycobacteriales bacterium]
MVSRGRSNPLALAVLSCLAQQPMHPYEIASTLRERGKDTSIKINYGSLYTVVESLLRRGLIAEKETVREGRRPERTVYAITPAGRNEHDDWLGELISRPVAEFTQFEAALSLAGGLPPAEVQRLLELRRSALRIQLEADKATHQACLQQGLPELFMIELEYRIALRKAELEFVTELTGRIRNRRIGGIEIWESFHSGADDAQAEAAHQAAVAALEERMRATATRGGHPVPAASAPEAGPPAAKEPPMR